MNRPVLISATHGSRLPVAISLLAMVALATLAFQSGQIVSPAPAPTPLRAPDFGKLPLQFEHAPGQAVPDGRFVARRPDSTLLFMPSEVVFLTSPRSKVQGPTSGQEALDFGPWTPDPVRLRFLGANPSPTVVGEEIATGKVSYLLGSDPAGWRTGLPTYGQITYRELYPGIALSYSGTGGTLKGTYTLAPNADPSLIRWRYAGAQSVALDANGNLLITPANPKSKIQNPKLEESAPVAWQEIAGRRVDVSASYAVAADGIIAFNLGSYDPGYPLVIDPLISYATYLGGSAGDGAYDIALDSAGNIYVTGQTGSLNFPVQSPVQGEYGGGESDVFVTKFNPAGTAVIYSTYIGGFDIDVAYSIGIDAAGQAYVAGRTMSPDFPTHNAYQLNLAGSEDAFVSVLNAGGTWFAYSTYLGGSDIDFALGIGATAGGSAYVTGQTRSANFPTQNAFQPTFGGSIDAFVTRFTPSGTALDYSTFLGGASTDQTYGIDVDGAEQVYVVGYTWSSDFPTQSPYQPANGGESDAFISKLAANGSSLLYSTYLGGSGPDFGTSIVLDGSSNMYITGYTRSANFPTQNAYQPQYGGEQDAFVTAFNASGASLRYSTYLGGFLPDYGLGIDVDSAGSAYVTGFTQSPNFPTQSAMQAALAGPQDAFVTRLSAGGSASVPSMYSTFVGGSDVDAAFAVTVRGDASSGFANAYVTGSTHSRNFTTYDPWQPSSGGGDDAFISRVTQCTFRFNDIQPSDWFYEYIGCHYCKGTIVGYVDGTFRPGNNTTRGQVAKIVVLTFDLEEYIPPTPTFSDVPATDTFYRYIETAAHHGVISGYADGTFQPYNNVTRAQLAKMLVQAGDWPPINPATPTFSDVPIDHPFYQQVETAYCHAVITGYADGTFHPYNYATRAQIAKVTCQAVHSGGVCGPAPIPTGSVPLEAPQDEETTP